MTKKTKSKSFSGSVLVFSLIIMFVMLVMGLGIIATTVTERKSSFSTGKSTVSFQVADSGAERVLQKIKNTSGQISALGTCSGGQISGSISSGKDYTITFYDSATSTPTLLGCGDDISKIKEIKSIGTYANTSRAVQVAVAAGGFSSCTTETSGTSSQMLTYTCNSGAYAIAGSCWRRSSGTFIGDKLESDGKSYTCRIEDGGGLDVYVKCCK